MSDTTTKLTYLVGAKRLQEKNRDTEYLLSQEQLEQLEALVRADERRVILPLLKGIDQTECESADGWWETSTGAAFGAGILAAIRARGNT